MFNERLNNLLQEIRTNSDSVEQLKDQTRDLSGILTIHRNLVEDKLNTLKSQLRVTKNEISDNKAILKEQYTHFLFQFRSLYYPFFIFITHFSKRLFEEKQFDSIMGGWGYFCIGFINFMLNNKRLADFTKLFSPNSFLKMIK